MLARWVRWACPLREVCPRDPIWPLDPLREPSYWPRKLHHDVGSGHGVSLLQCLPPRCGTNQVTKFQIKGTRSRCSRNKTNRQKTEHMSPRQALSRDPATSRAGLTSWSPPGQAKRDRLWQRPGCSGTSQPSHRRGRGCEPCYRQMGKAADWAERWTRVTMKRLGQRAGRGTRLPVRPLTGKRGLQGSWLPEWEDRTCPPFPFRDQEVEAIASVHQRAEKQTLLTCLGNIGSTREQWSQWDCRTALPPKAEDFAPRASGPCW